MSLQDFTKTHGSNVLENCTNQIARSGCISDSENLIDHFSAYTQHRHVVSVYHTQSRGSHATMRRTSSQIRAALCMHVIPSHGLITIHNQLTV